MTGRYILTAMIDAVTITKSELRRLPLAPGAAHLLRRIGHAPERRALIFCAEQLFVVPAADIVGFRADRMQPAKGSGGSSLVVECHRPGHAGNPTTIRFDSGPGPDDMNGLCIECGQLFDKPALLGEYYPDI